MNQTDVQGETERALRAITCEGCRANIHSTIGVFHRFSIHEGYGDCTSKHAELLPLFNTGIEQAMKVGREAEAAITQCAIETGNYSACIDENTQKVVAKTVAGAYAAAAKRLGLLADAQDARQTSQPNGETSDGYHTFNELYEHRHSLFSIICHTFDGWKSKLHSDGTMFDGWFIAGVQTPQGQATYHLPQAWWERFACKELSNAPEWDGHTPADVVTRLQALTLPAAIASAEARGVRKASEALAVDWEKREPASGAWLGRAKHAAVLLENLATEIEAAARTPDSTKEPENATNG